MLLASPFLIGTIVARLIFKIMQNSLNIGPGGGFNAGHDPVDFNNVWESFKICGCPFRFITNIFGIFHVQFHLTNLALIMPKWLTKTPNLTKNCLIFVGKTRIFFKRLRFYKIDQQKLAISYTVNGLLNNLNG